MPKLSRTSLLLGLTLCTLSLSACGDDTSGADMSGDADHCMELCNRCGGGDCEIVCSEQRGDRDSSRENAIALGCGAEFDAYIACTEAQTGCDVVTPCMGANDALAACLNG